MRTAIFLGLTAIADAIRKDWLETDNVSIISAIFLAMVLMDVADFFKNQFKN